MTLKVFPESNTGVYMKRRKPSYDVEDGDIVELPIFKGMRKLTLRQQKKFPNIVTDSMICQAQYIAKCEHCNGCDCAIDGCEKVVYMPAG